MNSLQDTRLYVVTSTDTGIERIIRAESKAKAVRRACIARIASQSDLERLLTAGVVAETAQSLEAVSEPKKAAAKKVSAKKAAPSRPKTLRKKRGRPRRVNAAITVETEPATRSPSDV